MRRRPPRHHDGLRVMADHSLHEVHVGSGVGVANAVGFRPRDRGGFALRWRQVRAPRRRGAGSSGFRRRRSRQASAARQDRAMRSCGVWRSWSTRAAGPTQHTYGRRAPLIPECRRARGDMAPHVNLRVVQGKSTPAPGPALESVARPHRATPRQASAGTRRRRDLVRRGPVSRLGSRCGKAMLIVPSRRGSTPDGRSRSSCDRLRRDRR